jgi:hypothetical protein
MLLHFSLSCPHLSSLSIAYLSLSCNTPTINGSANYDTTYWMRSGIVTELFYVLSAVYAPPQMSQTTRDRVRGLFRRKKSPEVEVPESEASTSSPVLNSAEFIGLSPERADSWGSLTVNVEGPPRRAASHEFIDRSAEGQNLRPPLGGPAHRRVVSQDSPLNAGEQRREPDDVGPPLPRRIPNGFEFNVDPSVDPELALALKLSLEEEKARIARAERAERARQHPDKEVAPVRRKPVAKVNQAATSARPRLPDLIDLTSSGHDRTQGISSQPFNSVQAFHVAIEPPSEEDLIDLAFSGQDQSLDTLWKPFESMQTFNPAVEPATKANFQNALDDVNTTLGSDRYTYTSLREDDIRLLVLRPKQESHFTIECDIIHVSLRDRKIPEYEALSYCWGKHGVTHEIQLEGKKMMVGENLWVALRNLRGASEGKERRLWVDALCINQRNVEERSIQVLRMGSIYQHAQRVVISLGGSTSEGVERDLWDKLTIQEHADAHMGCAMSAIKAGTAGIEDVGNHYFPCNDIEELPEWSSPCFGTSLSVLLSSPWFRRRWVIQELAFSKEAVVQWGNHQVPWEALVDFVTWAEEFKDQIQFGEKIDTTGQPGMSAIDRTTRRGGLTLRQDGQGAGITIKKIEGLVFASKRMVQRGRHGNPFEKIYGLYPLDTLVTRFAAFNVTDPRDIVYSLLAFAQDKGNWHPDYEKSVHEVFVEFFQYAVRKTSRLDIICFPWARMYGKTLPTWIKPWLGSPTRPLFAEFVEPVFEEALLQIDTMHMYSASGSTVAREVEFRLDDRYILRTSGIWVGIVCLRTRPMSPDVTVHYTEQFKEWYRAAIGWHLSEERSRSAQSNSRQRLPRERSKANLMTPSKPASRQFDSLRDSFFKVVVAGKYSWENTPYTDKALFKMGLKETDFGITACSPLFQRIRPACYGRRLIWTDTGKLGLVPRNTEASDMICVLFGCSVPVILRPKDGRYIVIGECYIDGMMNGEAVLEYEMGKYQKMMFDIQ